jgi:collagenase-like PrtC family protease
MNTACEGTEWYEPDVMKAKMEYISILHQKHGMEAITVSNPVYIEEIRRNFPEIEICASVMSCVDSVQKAVYFNKLGADVIVIDTDINRDMGLLLQIKKATTAS